MRTTITATLVLSIVTALAACSNVGMGGANEPIEPGMTASSLIGPSGGTVRLGGASVEIPPGALSTATEIRISVADVDSPAAFSAYSSLLRFEPVGLRFDAPVRVRIPYVGAPDRATIFWTAGAGGSFMSLETATEEGVATADVNEFSEGFVGSACEGEGCCDAANGRLDVVLLIDNSNSMAEEQAALASQLPRMARVLATGDLDGDGVQDFPALESVRIGVVTSDMGAGGYAIQTCDDSERGDDGVLRTAGSSEIAGCNASYPAFAELSASDDAAAIEEFVHHVECVGMAGTGGCGFEQQLESILKAVTPSDSPLPFLGDTRGHGDDVNAGFVRPDSILSFIMLTDEGDCSAADPSFFDPARDDLGPLNTRCALEQSELYPVSRYIEGLQSLRDDPADVIFSLIAGVPVDLVSDPEAIDYDELLADPRMTDRVDPADPNTVVPSCSTSNGMAYPPRRMVEVAQGFGDSSVVQSICQSDFTPAIQAILARVAARVAGGC